MSRTYRLSAARSSRTKGARHSKLAAVLSSFNLAQPRSRSHSGWLNGETEKREGARHPSNHPPVMDNKRSPSDGPPARLRPTGGCRAHASEPMNPSACGDVRRRREGHDVDLAYFVREDVWLIPAMLSAGDRARLGAACRAFRVCCARSAAHAYALERLSEMGEFEAHLMRKFASPRDAHIAVPAMFCDFAREVTIALPREFGCALREMYRCTRPDIDVVYIQQDNGARARVFADDVIVRINGNPVRDTEDACAQLANARKIVVLHAPKAAVCARARALRNCATFDDCIRARAIARMLALVRDERDAQQKNELANRAFAFLGARKRSGAGSIDLIRVGVAQTRCAPSKRKRTRTRWSSRITSCSLRARIRTHFGVRGLCT